MNHYEKIIYLLEGKIKAANKAKKRGFAAKKGREFDALTVDPNPEKTIKRGVLAARHSSALTHKEKTTQGVRAIERGRYRDAQKKDSLK